MKTSVLVSILSFLLLLQLSLYSQTPETDIAHKYTAGFVANNPNLSVVGSRYLFKQWVKGSIIDLSGTVYDVAKLKYMYDKITNNLLMSEDTVSVYECDKDRIKSFSLLAPGDKDKNIKEYIFERVDLIDKQSFFEPLVKSDNFSLYRSLRTTFVKSDYTDVGVLQRGNKNDEYVDKNEYYIILPGGKEFRKVQLNRKSIRRALNMESVNTEAFLSKHKFEFVNEDYLKSLISDINLKRSVQNLNR